MLNFIVENNKCINCGLCVKDCPANIIEIRDEIPVITNEDTCLKCQHCLAICPTGAISILGNAPENSTPLENNLPDAEKVKTLIKGRRSVRWFKNESLEKSEINELLNTASHAPTGVNSQTVLFTANYDKKRLDELRNSIYTKLATTDTLENLQESPIKNYMFAANKLWQEKNYDLIFRGAPHLLIASAPKNSPCPQIDTTIALSYFELYAQSKEIGTVWDGIFMWILSSIYPEYKQELNIPEDHTFGFAMAFGKPDIHYQRTIERGQAKINRF